MLAQLIRVDGASVQRASVLDPALDDEAMAMTGNRRREPRRMERARAFDLAFTLPPEPDKFEQPGLTARPQQELAALLLRMNRRPVGLPCIPARSPSSFGDV